MTQPAESTETPGESPLLAIDGDRVVHATTEIDDFGDVYRRYVAVFTLFDIQHNTFRTGLEIEAQLRAGFEIFAVGVVAQLAVFGQTEGM